jgi:hypothetical protein
VYDYEWANNYDAAKTSGAALHSLVVYAAAAVVVVAVSSVAAPEPAGMAWTAIAENVVSSDWMET